MSEQVKAKRQQLRDLLFNGKHVPWFEAGINELITAVQLAASARPEAAQRVKGQWRDAHGKHKWEDAAMKVVSAIHDHIVPTMDDNDGGEILSWILKFAEEVEIARPEAAQPHICSGCHHRWEGPLTGAELCGDCWRKAQSVVMARPEAAHSVQDSRVFIINEHALAKLGDWFETVNQKLTNSQESQPPSYAELFTDIQDGVRHVGYLLELKERARPEAAAPLEKPCYCGLNECIHPSKLREGYLCNVVRDAHKFVAGGAIPAPRETKCHHEFADLAILVCTHCKRTTQELVLEKALAAAEAARITLYSLLQEHVGCKSDDCDCIASILAALGPDQ